MPRFLAVNSFKIGVSAIGEDISSFSIKSGYLLTKMDIAGEDIDELRYFQWGYEM